MTTRNFLGKLLCSTALFSSFVIYSNHVLAQDAVQLDTISVESALDAVSDATTKTDDKLINTLAGTSLVTQEEIKRFQSDSAGGLLAAVPGVNIEEASDDPGVAINIRGLQDFGRVNVMIDGARQNFQRSGHNADGQFYLEPEMVKKVDIVRGPVSTIYGSGAIGGVVNFETIDPADMLRHGETWAASIKGQYSTNDEGKLVSAIGAVKATDTVSMLANFVWRDHDNYEDGNGDLVENTDKELVSGLIKGVFDFGVGNQLKLGYIHKKDEYTTGLISDENQQDTEAEDQTFSAQWAYNPTGNDLIDLNVSGYFTSTELTQTRLETLSKTVVVFPPFGPPIPSFVDQVVTPAGSERTFEVDTFGFDIFNSSRFTTGQFNHTLTYGGDYFKDDVTTSDPNGSGALFTPSGERETYGFYIQEKLEYNDWFELIAALRYDSYELSGNGFNVEEDQLSPKITVGVTPIKGIQFYATYAEGFRAPAVSETLQSGVHPVPPEFDIIPNVNLRPETAENIEGGVNLAFDKIFNENDVFRAKASIFRNDVDDFIEDRVVGLNPATCFNPFVGIGCGESQYVNIANARLEGFELEATYDNKLMFVNLAYTHVRGDDLTTNQPLKSIYPDKVVATVGFRFLEDKLMLGGRWTYADAQNRVPDPVNPNDLSIDETPTPSYNLVDLFATYDVNENFSTALTLNNIFDENYRIHRHEENEPGFSAKLSATVRFGG